MKKLHFFISLTVFISFLWACEKKTVNDSKPEEEKVVTKSIPKLPPLDDAKKSFLDKVTIENLYPDEIKVQLDSFSQEGLSETGLSQSESITDTDVYQYCLQSNDLVRKTALIAAVSSGMANFGYEENPDYWGSILYNMEQFTQGVSVLKEPHQKSFVDIGSGNGEKIYAALCLGFESSHGLEYAADLVTLSDSLLQNFVEREMVTVTHGDALKITGDYYAQFDFLYMYSPIKSHETMAELFQIIMNNMKEGAILFEVRMVYNQELRDLTGYQIPEVTGQFAIKKQEGKFYYGNYDILGNKEWVVLEKNDILNSK